jgi:hypothetical protein
LRFWNSIFEPHLTALIHGRKDFPGREREMSVNPALEFAGADGKNVAGHEPLRGAAVAESEVVDIADRRGEPLMDFRLLMQSNVATTPPDR